MLSSFFEFAKRYPTHVLDLADLVQRAPRSSSALRWAEEAAGVAQTRSGPSEEEEDVVRNRLH